MQVVRILFFFATLCWPATLTSPTPLRPKTEWGPAMRGPYSLNPRLTYTYHRQPSKEVVTWASMAWIGANDNTGSGQVQ